MYDGELDTVGYKKMYEELYKLTSYFSQFGMYEEELIDSNELKKQIFPQEKNNKDENDANNKLNNIKKTTNKIGALLFIIILIIVMIPIIIYNYSNEVSYSPVEQVEYELTGNWNNMMVDENLIDYKGKQCIYAHTYDILFNEGKFMLFKNEIYATEDKNGNMQIVEENNYFDAGILLKENEDTYLQLLDVDIEEFSKKE